MGVLIQREIILELFSGKGLGYFVKKKNHNQIKMAKVLFINIYRKKSVFAEKSTKFTGLFVL